MLAALLGGVLVAACEQPPSTSPNAGVAPTRGQPEAQAADAGVADAPAKEPGFQEQEFSESDRSRDPFRSYEDVFLAESKTKVQTQRAVILQQYSLDELKLIGIVQRADPAMAMLLDPEGKGHTIVRGQFVGRAEVVQGPGSRGASYELNWRVEKIRDGDVVFVREDPANPDVPSATKVIPLRPEGTLAAAE